MEMKMWIDQTNSEKEKGNYVTYITLFQDLGEKQTNKQNHT